MTKDKSKVENQKSKIVIVGAAVAGASAAIRLAEKGFGVSLIEKEKFPREKLCGEFISPECFEHFRELGVLKEMFAANGETITETVFYAPSGANIAVPSQWFSPNAAGALGLSRAEMDFRLLERAKNAGVQVFEETQAVGVLEESGKICGVKLKNKNGELSEIAADLTVDASGRASVLSKFISRKAAKAQSENKGQRTKDKGQKTKFVGFKAHLKNARIERGRCEIYFFPGGYGGLNFVENDLANHCFLIEAKIVRQAGGEAEKVLREIVFKNKRAAEMLKNAAAVHEWLAVSVDDFGRKNLAPAPGLLAIGDAAAFIDPFTGSGMLMALESAELAARAIAESAADFDRIADNYKTLHGEKFNRRLRVCSLLRRAAFFPNLATTAIRALSFSQSARRILARSTRPEIGDANFK